MDLIQTLFGDTAPPLKPSGPAPFAQPPERDRQALFWWLRRNSSYTAIEHNAKIWAAFMAEYEAWLRKQSDPYERFIEALKFGLDTQLFYEKGLQRLLRGDRSVFNWKSSEGWLGKVNTSSVGNRIDWFDPPPEFVADRDNCPLSLVKQYLTAHEAAMAVGHTTSYRGMGSPRGSAVALLASLPFPTPLPEPQWDISFAPGKRAPNDGIYEMVNPDGSIIGSLEYFIKGQQADATDFVEFGPEAGNENSSALLWRLLWEDTRYKDGVIPDEENLYPLPSESAQLAKDQVSPSTSPIRMRCEAGQPCPADGEWSTPAAQVSRHFKQGEIMPDMASDYGQTIWYCEQEVS